MSESAKTTDMVDVVGKAIAAADGGRFVADRARYRRLAVAAIRPLGIVRLTPIRLKLRFTAAHETRGNW